jgi:hypothetical protein
MRDTQGMKKTTIYIGYRYPFQIISRAVWLYHRFTLRFCDIQVLLAACRITVSYEYIKIAASSCRNNESADDNGIGIGFGLGVRSRLTEKFEVDGSIGYVDIADESETAFGVSGYYYFTNELAVGAHYSSTADVSVYGASLRYSF